MKILTKEEEQAHYNATLRGGFMGGALGLAVGIGGVALASRQLHTFRSLTVPFRAFIAIAPGTFCSVIAADRASAQYDIDHNPQKQQEIERERARGQELAAGKTTLQRAKEWGEANRYPIIFGFWVVSMGTSLALVNRNKYLSSPQKLVQARMYAQGLTIAVLLASFAAEGTDAAKGKGRWETIKVLDPDDPTHQHVIEKRIHKERYAGEDQWREMIEAEEARINARKEAGKAKLQHEKESEKKESKAGSKSTSKSDSTSESKGESKGDSKSESKSSK